MRLTAVFAGITLLLGPVASAAGAESGRQRAWQWSHTRPTSRFSADLIAQAAARSRTVRAQLEQIEHTDVVVYVFLEFKLGDAGRRPRASLRFVGATAPLRYVMITINGYATAPPERIAHLGHELQHALEVAESPEVTDPASFEQLYARIGWLRRPRQYETARARDAGFRVRRELAR